MSWSAPRRREGTLRLSFIIGESEDRSGTKAVPSDRRTPRGGTLPMGTFTFIVRNILGRPARTLLTVSGIGVGIAAVVMLTGISWGFERSMGAIYRSRGIDLIVVRAGLSDHLSSNLDEAMI